MANTTYLQAIGYVQQLRASLIANNAVRYLLPQEITALQQLPYAPKQTVHLFNRNQAIELLMRAEIGLTLEWHAKAFQSQSSNLKSQI